MPQRDDVGKMQGEGSLRALSKGWKWLAYCLLEHDLDSSMP